MEIFFSAVLGELATRSMSFFIDKYSKPPALAVEAYKGFYFGRRSSSRRLRCGTLQIRGPRGLTFLTSNDQKQSINKVSEASHCTTHWSFSRPPVAQSSWGQSPQMEIFLSAVLGELTTRSISFFINNYYKSPMPAVEDRLQRILLRAQVIVDEAAGRHITNRGMLQQLSMLRDAMYRGYYILDTFRYQAHEEEEAKDQVVSHSSTLSKFNYARRFCLSSSSSQALQELQEVLNSLNTIVLAVNELVVFLKSYPRLYRQPYSIHLLLDKCMFGRQMEMGLVINFLLHTKPPGVNNSDVLPIVGPGRVGKSTLVAHVCNDERVRNYFSRIVFLRDNDFRDEMLGMKYQNYALHEDGRLLVVVEVVGGLNEDAWERLYSASTQCTTSGSKIIITSRSDKIMKFGTVQALTLKHLSQEAFWYFFKVITFGSTDPEMHPRLAYLAMEIGRELNVNLVGANVTACLLRQNFNIQYWCKVLSLLRGYVQKHLSKFGEHPAELLKENKPTYVPRMGRATEDLLIYDQYQTCSSQEDIPKITIQDVMYGSVKPHGKFKVLSWKSQIPPYHNYIYTCEIRELQSSTAVKRKRSLNNRTTLG